MLHSTLAGCIEPLHSNHLMTFRQLIRPLIATVVVAAGTSAVLVACGSRYQAPAIMIAFSTSFPPPSALNAGATAGIAAVVTNDNANGGVSFSCLPAGQCGSFDPSPIASNVPTTYQAPSAIPPGNTVTVTATSVTDSSKFVSATITIN
jgi:hypothetical protein